MMADIETIMRDFKDRNFPPKEQCYKCPKHPLVITLDAQASILKNAFNEYVTILCVLEQSNSQTAALMARFIKQQCTVIQKLTSKIEALQEIVNEIGPECGVELEWDDDHSEIWDPYCFYRSSEEGAKQCPVVKCPIVADEEISILNLWEDIYSSSDEALQKLNGLNDCFRSYMGCSERATSEALKEGDNAE